MNNSTDTNDIVSQKNELTGIIIEDETEQLPFGLMKFLSKVEEIKHQLMCIENNNELMKIKYERITKQMKVSDVIGTSNLPPELQTLNIKEEKRFHHQMKLKKESSKRINKIQSINSLAYVKSKHDEIITIIRSIDELAQTFVDAAILVEMQGEMINNICDNCEQAKEYTTEALININKAKRLRKPNRFVCFFFVPIV
ncbi:SNARE domain containing protein [Entamoeba nuttalli P19]|uniref:SNARE domain containing protein n=1 Tax=Entamoeba nuttalli (strain P19) TaxID=1076696 RepID=K2GUK9_ENTNP|nr:SNARE domain containing protein [Entamoeba nuttalli P19]EKE37542.1 SNARE domain containing protein [Entamoeba nuttalli P19]|eukprot:XP_008860122.1 SNARE domain containing protein [Entamoeba nuttalli P19]